MTCAGLRGDAQRCGIKSPHGNKSTCVSTFGSVLTNDFGEAIKSAGFGSLNLPEGILGTDLSAVCGGLSPLSDALISATTDGFDSVINSLRLGSSSLLESVPDLNLSVFDNKFASIVDSLNISGVSDIELAANFGTPIVEALNKTSLFDTEEMVSMDSRRRLPAANGSGFPRRPEGRFDRLPSGLIRQEDDDVKII